MLSPTPPPIICILQIPLQVSEVTDHLTWSREASSLYSVKSAYQLLQQLKGRFNEGAATTFWKKLRALRIPPKVKNLMWRASTGCLPTMSQLLNKRVIINTSCPICHNSEETIVHSLISCKNLKQCWDTVKINTHVQQGSNFLDWCVNVFESLTAEKMSLVATIYWAIWSARNVDVWQRKLVQASNIVASAKGYLDQWQNAQNSPIEMSWSGLHTNDGAEHWTLPQKNSIKVNVDAALFEEDRKYGVGLVVRDDNGIILEGCTKISQGSVAPALAEAMGVKEALGWLKDHHWRPAMVETDCLLVVQAIRSSVNMISLFGKVIQECKSIFAQLGDISLCFVKRSANVVAHKFVRAFILYSDRIFCLGDMPAHLLLDN